MVEGGCSYQSRTSETNLPLKRGKLSILALFSLKPGKPTLMKIQFSKLEKIGLLVHTKFGVMKLKIAVSGSI